MKSPYDVIIKPVITEKTMAITEEGKYTFVVAPDAEKPEIKAAAEKLFGVKVLSVNVANYDGKVKRLRNKPGKTPAYKKAYSRPAAVLQHAYIFLKGLPISNKMPEFF